MKEVEVEDQPITWSMMMEPSLPPTEPKTRSLAELVASFDQYSNPTEDQTVRVNAVREAFKLCARAIHENCPDCPELVVAVSTLHEAFEIASNTVMKEPNVFFTDNLTARGQFMRNNPYRWESYMRGAGLMTPYQLHKK